MDRRCEFVPFDLGTPAHLDTLVLFEMGRHLLGASAMLEACLCNGSIHFQIHHASLACS